MSGCDELEKRLGWLENPRLKGRKGVWTVYYGPDGTNTFQTLESLFEGVLGPEFSSSRKRIRKMEKRLLELGDDVEVWGYPGHWEVTWVDEGKRVYGFFKNLETARKWLKRGER